MLMTSLYVAIAALLLIVLSFNVAAKRYRLKTGLGDKGDKTLLVAIRAQANLVEYAPMTLLLLLLVEMSHSPVIVIHTFGVAFILSRVSHAFGFIKARGGMSIFRMVGTLLNWIIICLLAVYLLVMATI